MNNQQTEKIYKDLVSIDPSFAQNEQAVKNLISELVLARQDIAPDEDFAKALRHNLAVRINQTKKNHSHQKSSKSLIPTFMKRLNFAITAAVAVAVVALVTFSNLSNPVLLPSGQEIAMAQEGAFGELTNVQNARAQGGGGGGNASADIALYSTLPSVAPMDVINTPKEMSVMPVSYKFVYTGEDFSIDSDKLEVFRRIKGFGSNVNFSFFLDNFDIQMFNADKFGLAQLEYFRVSEDKDFGYALDINLKEGTVNINENWQRWMTPERQCRNPECYELNKLKIEDIPADSVVVDMTNQFMDEYGIDRASFGEPYVQNFWKAEYERMANKSMFYVPDYVSVIYPLKIDGREIYDQSGNKTGISVTVNVRAKKVSAVYELTSQRYESSLYEVENDSNKIKEVAERGGFQSWYPLDLASNVEEVELGTPTIQYVRLWHDMNGTAQDLYVPSFVFPVTKAPNSSFYPQNIIVPVVKDILNSSMFPGQPISLERPGH